MSQAIRPLTQVNRIYGYCRVSTKEQVRNGISIETQQKQITEFVKQKYNRPVDEWFVDEGISGKANIVDRPGSRALTDTMDECDVLVCTRLDRFSRSTSDLLSIIPNLEATNVTLFFCEQFADVPIVYPKFEGEKGLRTRFDMAEMTNKIMLMVLSAVAEIEHGMIKDRLGDGKIEWAERGYAIGGSIPFGFKAEKQRVGEGKSARTRTKLVRDPETYPIYLSILRLKKRGLGPRRIANQINSLYKGADMSYSRVRKILDRKFQGLPEVA